MKEQPVIFAIPSYKPLGERIAKLTGYKQGELELQTFPDGEKYVRILDKMQMRDAVVIGGTINDESTLELYDLAYGLAAAGCRQLTLAVPFFGYSTMERAARPGEVVTAKARARLLSSIPRTPLGNKIALLDLHSEGLPYYFEDDVTPTHLYAKPVVLEAVKELGGKSLVLASTDAGRAKWVESLANEAGVDAAFIIKRRLSGSATQVRAVSADVKGRDVVIYDDMIRTGGSVLKAAEAYKAAGAREISLIATHGLFTDDALAKFKASGLIKRVVCTDSHPNALAANEPAFLKISSIDGVFAQFLKSVHSGAS
ncbi:MAG TPA: ribose-phosphate diphosphokinase [Bdellovibrionales bacterium]|nr:ribose-phosphate diphosphokinase [Bdellovibrionales bacterium]